MVGTVLHQYPWQFNPVSNIQPEGFLTVCRQSEISGQIHDDYIICSTYKLVSVEPYILIVNKVNRVFFSVIIIGLDHLFKKLKYT